MPILPIRRLQGRRASHSRMLMAPPNTLTFLPLEAAHTLSTHPCGAPASDVEPDPHRRFASDFVEIRDDVENSHGASGHFESPHAMFVEVFCFGCRLTLDSLDGLAVGFEVRDEVFQDWVLEVAIVHCFYDFSSPPFEVSLFLMAFNTLVLV